MARALIIGEAERAAIAALIEKAAAAPTPFETIKKLAEARERIGVFNPLHEEFTIEIPQGFRVTYTHEYQRADVVCRHMSVSLRSENRAAPSLAAFQMVMEAFGFVSRFPKLPMWLEKMDDGTPIVSAVEPLDGDMAKLKKPE